MYPRKYFTLNFFIKVILSVEKIANYGICLVLWMSMKEHIMIICCICGYHVYNDIWSATVREEL